jgi:hypothetical protein
MCFIGDETAWITLLHEIVPMLKENTESAKIMGKILKNVIRKLYLIKLDRGTVNSIESYLKGNIFDLIGK